MAPALVKQRDVPAAFVPREVDLTLVRDHCFGKLCINPAGDVPVIPVGTPKRLENKVLLCSKSCLTGSVNVLARDEPGA
jgi:hypothetical protein